MSPDAFGFLRLSAENALPDFRLPHLEQIFVFMPAIYHA